MDCLDAAKVVKDEDVQLEEDAILNRKLPKSTAVVIENLRKVYTRPGGTCKRDTQYAAVKSLCLSIEEDTLFCLLGPNGAGKVRFSHD